MVDVKMVFGQQRDDGEGCATMRERQEGWKRAGAYIELFIIKPTGVTTDINAQVSSIWDKGQNNVG